MTSRLRIRFPVLSAAALAGALTGCVLADGESACLCPPPTAPILPLAVGNVWEYVDSVTHSMPAGDSVSWDSLRVSITGSRTVAFPEGDREVFLWNVHARSTGLPGALQLRVENRTDGNHTVGAEQDSAAFLLAPDEASLHVKYPATAGERYPTVFLSFRDSAGRLVPVRDHVEIEVAHADTTCTVPAGTFSCVHYRGRRDGEVFADSWYAPGIGWLGSRSVRVEGSGDALRTVTTRRMLRAYALLP